MAANEGKCREQTGKAMDAIAEAARANEAEDRAEPSKKFVEKQFRLATNCLAAVQENLSKQPERSSAVRGNAGGNKPRTGGGSDVTIVPANAAKPN